MKKLLTFLSIFGAILLILEFTVMDKLSAAFNEI